MIDPNFVAESPESVGIDPVKLEALFDRAGREVREGLLSSTQVAVARRGRIAGMRTFGTVTHQGRPAPATDDTLYVVFSSTKAITSAATWLMMQEGKLSPEDRVADLVPEFGTHGKDAVTVEQLLTHTAGFPLAPYPQKEWGDRDARLARFAQWRLNFPAGSRFWYHPTSSMWVAAELVERLSGVEFRQFVRERIALPLGLPDLHVGLPRALHGRLADTVHAGEEMTQEEMRAAGFPAVEETEVTEEALQGFNDPDVREAGVPGGGGVMTAAELALFYQALVNGGRALGGEQVWKPETIERARRVRTGDLTDPIFGKRANRGLGVVIAGDRDRNYRGFGHTGSELMFGHNGAGGQIAFGDPVSGISVGYCTNAHDRHRLRQGRRGVAIASRAADLAID
jgi:CubicO group peptidase (beta-lactamase class C family)